MEKKGEGDVMEREIGRKIGLDGEQKRCDEENEREGYGMEGKRCDRKKLYFTENAFIVAL